MTANERTEIHPGEILREEFMLDEITAYRLAKDLNVPLTRITAILGGNRKITVDTAMRLGRYFGNSAMFWLNLQARHDIQTAEANDSYSKICEEVQPRERASE